MVSPLFIYIPRISLFLFFSFRYPTATLAFLIARYLARPIVAKQLSQRFRAFDKIDEAIAKDGWKIVFLWRLSPLFPFAASNYMYETCDEWRRPFSMPRILCGSPFHLFALKRHSLHTFQEELHPECPSHTQTSSRPCTRTSHLAIQEQY